MTAVNRNHSLRPRVAIVADGKGQRMASPKTTDLANALRLTVLVVALVGALGALASWRLGWFGGAPRPKELLRQRLEAPLTSPGDAASSRAAPPLVPSRSFPRRRRPTPSGPAPSARLW